MACEEVICKTVEIKTDKTQKNLGDVEKSMGSVNQMTAGLEKGLGNLPGPLGKVKQGIGGLSKAFKALLANPIVLLIAAIVAALVGLFKAFTKTQEGADKMNDVMKALGSALDVITERAAKLFKALGKLFKGDFRGAAEDAKAAVAGVKDELIEAANAALELEAAQRKLHLSQSELIVANAERRQQIADLVFLTRDMTKSVEERRDAIQKAGALEDEILASNVAQQQERLRLLELEKEANPGLIGDREHMRQIAEAEAALIQLDIESTGKQRELKNRLNTLDMEAAAAEKTRHDARMKQIQEETDALTKMADLLAESDRQAKEEQFDLDEMFREEELKAEEEAAKERERIKQEETASLIELSKKRFDEDEKLALEQLQNEERLKNVKAGIYQDSLTALLGFLGKGSKAAKAIQIADATRTAIQGAINAFTSAWKLPPPLNAIMAPIAGAAALAAGMANVRKLAQTPDPAGGGGGAVPSVALASPQSAINPEDLTNVGASIPQDVSIIQDRTTGQRATRTYVVESEVTAEQEIAKKREADVTL